VTEITFGMLCLRAFAAAAGLPAHAFDLPAALLLSAFQCLSTYVQAAAPAKKTPTKKTPAKKATPGKFSAAMAASSPHQLWLNTACSTGWLHGYC
jgi:hypothetical protein